MVDVSIVIPIAPYHKEIASRAIESAKKQTAPCVIIPVDDKDGRGAGWARNHGLKQVQTHFVVFLDADDWIEPTFVEQCLNWIKPNHYVYTDWYQENEPKAAPESAWDNNGSWHVITTLLETAVVRKAGGFNEQLAGAEDTFFYWHITRKGRICGIHIPAPLFHYGKEGRRARAFVQSPEYKVAMGILLERYGKMTCCGDTPLKPSDSGQPGDVLAQALWQGNMRRVGRITGRLYPRTSFPHVQMVAPADIQAAPEEWQAVPPDEELAPPPPLPIQSVAPIGKVYELSDLAQKVFSPNTPTVLTADQLVRTLPESVKPDVSRIKALARNKATKAQIEAIAERDAIKLIHANHGIIEEKVEKPKRVRKSKAK